MEKEDKLASDRALENDKELPSLDSSVEEAKEEPASGGSTTKAKEQDQGLATGSEEENVFKSERHNNLGALCLVS